MVDALHHVYNQQLTIEEMCRVVRNDGIIMIEEPDITQGSIKILALAEKLLLMQSHFLSPEEIALIFGHNGLKTQIVRDSYNAWVVAGNNL